MTPLVMASTAAVAVLLIVAAVWYYARVRYSGPWFLLVGPTDAGRAALLTGARETALPRLLRRLAGRTPDVAWHYFGAGAVIDVAARLVFPREGHDAVAWERLLRLLRRYRPRRPIDGVIVTVPAPEALGVDWQTTIHEMGAAVRDRLAQAQRHFGFTVPVYVVITQCEAVPGFAAFTGALPAPLLQTMVGWSNPHGADRPYASGWVAEGFTSLHRELVLAQVGVLATSAAVDDPSGLFLFSRDLMRLAGPTRAFLDEVFRPGLHQDAYFLRGFYISGEAGATRDGHEARGTEAAIWRPGASVPAFASDLLDQKVFAERGLASPVATRARTARRGVRVAQIAVAVLALALVVGTAWSYYRIRQMRAGYAALLTRGAELLEQRQQVRRGERTMADGERLAQSRQFLEQAQALDGRRLATIFLPAAWVEPLDARVSQQLTVVFGAVVLGDLRDGLTHKLEAWLASAVPDPEAASGGPSLKDNPHYQALDRFAGDYQAAVENLRRYDALSRGVSADLAGASDLLAYLNAGPLPSPATPPPVLRAVRAARAAAIDCRIFDSTDTPGTSLVGQRSAALLDVFGSRAFGDDNPVLVASTAFGGDWNAILDGSPDQESLQDLIGHTTDLATAVTTWGPIGTRSRAIALPVFDRAPFKSAPADARLCPALQPSLTEAITRITGQRDELSDRLLALQVDPFGALVMADEKGLVLGEGVSGLKAEFDTLQREPFWSPPPSETGGTLPANPVWKAEVMDDVVKVVDAYDVYRGRAFGQMAIDDRRELLAPVLAQVSRLVAARMVVTATGGASPATDPAARLDEITALGAQLGKASRLISLLAAADPLGPNVLQALDAQSVRALQDVERIAASRYPGVFAHRPGEILAAWADLQRTAGADAAKQWGSVVDQQRAGLLQLAKTAQPVVQFVTVRQASDLSRRWASVIADANGYDAKQPDNALVSLESLLRDGVPALAPERNCAPPTFTGSGGSPLRTAQKEIVDEGVRRCRADIDARYSAIAAAFNQLLAGKAPFSSQIAGAADASLDDVNAFLSVYERQQGKLLRAAFEARACPTDTLGFVRGVDAAATVLGGVRAATPPALALDVVPEFRVASSREVGGDQIAQWQVELSDQRATEGIPIKPLPWKAGDPVALTIRFARDSPSRPDSTIPIGRLQDRSARFEFGGQWALFQLVRAGRSNAATAARVADLPPTLLGFEIPVVRDPETPPLAGAEPVSPFEVFMRLRLFPQGKTDALPLDAFPTRAPVRLSCSGND